MPATRATPPRSAAAGSSFLFLLHLERAEVYDLVMGGVRDALIREGDDAEHDQEDADNG